MPNIPLSYLNIAIDIFSIIIAIIIHVACISEFSSKKMGSKHFLFLQFSVIVALIADAIGWIGEGNPDLSTLTTVANTVADCACIIAIISFMGYLTASLYTNSRAAMCILNIFRVLCALDFIFLIGNTFFGYAFYVNEEGHYVHSDSAMMAFVYLLFPIFSFFAIVLMSLFAKKTARINRLAFIIYTIFPVAGLILDHHFHGISMTFAGLTISIVVIYTSIYLKKQKQLESQKNALMLSQINPHFIYNTLSTIAAMCDTTPMQAKYLTIDFSQYLRRNIGTLTSEELISFEQEMEHVACYLKIEKARFRERLNINYAIQCKDFMIPPLTVQPLVENAVKHGVTKKSNGGTVKISTREEDKNYVIEIIDDGVGFETDSTEMHIGFETVKNRIATMCKGKLSVKSTVGVGTRVTIEIPKKKGNRQ